MLKISRLETRFQEIIFLLTIMIALSVTIGGVFYLTLMPQNLISVAGATGSSLVFKGFSSFGYTYFFFVLFILHMGHLVLGHSHYLRDVIRAKSAFAKSFAIYFTVLVMISSFLTVMEAYKGIETNSLLVNGMGGWFGLIVGGFLFKSFGLFGAMVILFSLTAVIGISAGYMDMVHSFYVMKDIAGELFSKIKNNGPLIIKNIGNQMIDFIDQKPAYAMASPRAAATALPSASVAKSAALHQGGRLHTDQYHMYRGSLAESQEVRKNSIAEQLMTETFHQQPPVMQEPVSQPEMITEEVQEEVPKKKTRARKTKVSGTKAKTKAKSSEVVSENLEDGDELAVESENKEIQVEIKSYKKRYKKLEVSILEKKEKRKIKTKKQMDEVSTVVAERLDSFGIKGKIIASHQGVTLTMFEFQPAAGVKLSKIQSLSDDLALVLGASAIRILTPIPGKSTVGIEVPNEDLSMLRFSELVPDLTKKKNQALPIGLGVDVYNKTQVADLAKMPHLLVSGTTGSGKSVFMNNIIAGLIFHKSPKELRFLMIDPKMIELSPYNGIPHLLKPVVTDVEEARDLLKWAEKEMDNRYQQFSDMQSKNIETFNAAVKKGSKRAVEGRIGKKIEWNFEPMPYIVIVIDELADLMLTQGKEVEIPITRIAQKARAAGIHLIIATQRPSADIVTGLIKTNFPTRVAFKVSSAIDSRTILDQPGADKLLGNGDMLYLAQGKSPERLQGSFITEDEVKKVVRFATQK